MLIEPIMSKPHDPAIVALRGACLNHFGIGIQSVAMGDWLHQFDVVETKFSNRVLTAILSGKTQHQREIDAAIGHDISAAEPTPRSEEHTSELQSLMRNSYADF